MKDLLNMKFDLHKILAENQEDVLTNGLSSYDHTTIW